MNNSPYRFYIYHSISDSGSSSYSIEELIIPSYFSSAKYFELKLLQCSLSGDRYIDNPPANAIWLGIDYMLNNKLLYKIITSGGVSEGNDIIQGLSLSKIFNLSAFVNGGCPDNNNYKIILPYREKYTLSFLNGEFSYIKDLKVNMIIEIKPLY